MEVGGDRYGHDFLGRVSTRERNLFDVLKDGDNSQAFLKWYLSLVLSWQRRSEL